MLRRIGNRYVFDFGRGYDPSDYTVRLKSLMRVLPLLYRAKVGPSEERAMSDALRALLGASVFITDYSDAVIRAVSSVPDIKIGRAESEEMSGNFFDPSEAYLPKHGLVLESEGRKCILYPPDIAELSDGSVTIFCRKHITPEKIAMFMAGSIGPGEAVETDEGL